MMHNKHEDSIISIIKQEIEKRNISVNKFAEEMNFSASTLYEILNGSTSPRLVTLKDICNALDLDIVIIHNEQDNAEEYRFINTILRLSPWEQKIIKSVVEMLEKSKDSE